MIKVSLTIISQVQALKPEKSTHNWVDKLDTIKTNLQSNERESQLSAWQRSNYCQKVRGLSGH